MKKLFTVIISLMLVIAPVPASAAGPTQMILGMANGIVGSAILLKCKLGTTQPSITVYFAGSLVYMAAEVLGGKTKGGDVKSNAQYMDNLKGNMKEGGDYQRASIDIQIKNEKDNLKHIQKKKTWMQATTAVYGIATILAGIEFILQFPPPPAGIGIGKPDIGACAPDGVTHKPAETAIVMAYVAANGYANGGLMGAGLSVATPYILKLLGQVKIGTVVRDAAVSMLNSSLGRAGFFGAATAIVGSTVGELTDEENRSKGIIADLEKVKGAFEGADNNIIEGTATAGAGGELANATGGSAQNAFAVAPLPPGTELPKHCFSTAGNAADYSEKACASPVKITRPVIQGNFDIPTLKSASNSATDMAQALADGDTARAEVEAQNLAALSGRIDTLKKEMMKKVDDVLKSQGKKPIDVEGELKRQIAGLNSELNKNNPGSGNFAFEDLKAPTPTLNDKPLVASVGTVVPSSGSEKPAAEAFKLTEPQLDANPNGIDAKSGDGTNSTQNGLTASASSQNEISSDPDVSIFKQVSMRYFLNYEKLFNRKKIDPPQLPSEEVSTATE
jgi:hypothetical protein